MDAVKQKEKFEQNSDDIDYFNNRMIRELSAYRLYDSRVWIPQAAALIDHKEMVEITHNLVMRRQKLRSRMEYNAGILKEQRTEVAKFMEEMVIVSKAVATAFECDKMNYECLGNGDTHLHWHLFPRVKGDLGEYGNDGKGPVWWLPQEIMWNKDNIPNEKELKKMKAKLLKELEKYV